MDDRFDTYLNAGRPIDQHCHFTQIAYYNELAGSTAKDDEAEPHVRRTSVGASLLRVSFAFTAVGTVSRDCNTVGTVSRDCNTVGTVR